MVLVYTSWSSEILRTCVLKQMLRICHHTHAQSGGRVGPAILPSYNPFGVAKGKGHMELARASPITLFKLVAKKPSPCRPSGASTIFISLITAAFVQLMNYSHVNACFFLRYRKPSKNRATKIPILVRPYMPNSLKLVAQG